MELIVVIGIIWVIGWVIGQLGNSGATTGGDTAAAWQGQKKFKCSMQQNQKEIRGEKFLVYEVAVEGSVSLPGDDHPCCFYVFLNDITEGERKPVISALEELQQSDSEIFEFRSGVQRLPYAQSVISEELTLCIIPADFLLFPRKGRRKLECTVILASVATEAPRVLEEATISYFVHRNDPGYEDLRAVEKQYEEAAVRLALYVAAADEHLGSDEGEVVKEWLKRRLGALEPGEEFYEREKERLNKYVTQGFVDAKDGNIDLDKECRMLKDNSPIGERYDVISLLLHVARADGVAEKGELEVLRETADKLGVNLEKFRELQNKILPVGLHAESGADEELVGINQDMTKDEIRKKLNQEYQKWNSRTTHSDGSVREQAKEMLGRIAQLRRKYID